MIDTVVFDIGNVLVPFNWEETWHDMFDDEIFEKIADATVRKTELWRELDKGELPFEMIMDKFIAGAPEYEQEIRLAVDEVYNRIRPYSYAGEWLANVKELGHRVLLLSNYGDRPFKLSEPHFDFMRCIDGAVISYTVQLTKPDDRIYNLLCIKYGVSPSSAVFIDDNEDNIKAQRL